MSEMMNQFDLSGIMQTYAERFRNARNRKQLLDIVDRLRSELDKRKIRFEGEKFEEK